jgi:hypothetical protein
MGAGTLLDPGQVYAAAPIWDAVLDGSVKNVSLNKRQDVEASGTEHMAQRPENCLNTSCGRGSMGVNV